MTFYARDTSERHSVMRHTMLEWDETIVVFDDDRDLDKVWVDSGY